MGSSEADDDQLLKSFLAEVSEVERDNEVLRFLSLHPPPPPPTHSQRIPFRIPERSDPQSRHPFCLFYSLVFHIVDQGKYEEQFERSDEFQKQLIIKVREILTDKEWRRRKMQMRISEEEGRLKKDEEETKEMWKRKREHEEKWEETRDKRVSSWRDFMKTGKKARKGELKPPRLKTEDPNKSYVQRPVKRG
ncbi:dnaJ homolog subfamily C member 8 [Brachypodium distachyon]|uniref:dnaJ homolog subfamily C member 8 n=1 Tax=Brachypodium distachyon TaxID=15368 RepID=UPI000D0CD834|nr:dnaJ homolog subfamily C member 8 [Brachypodium distachyon]|eukprot:XP_024314779.1 dnaJ homolog subfamily C member 8 [Brachypodium distachyon]